MIISLTTLQYFLMTTIFIALKKKGFISLMNESVVSVGFSKKVVNFRRRA